MASTTTATMATMATTSAPSYTQFACIGTGFSGICLGATLRRWYNITSLRLFDTSPSPGGTWTLNRYPGAACDVPSALYSYSFAPNPRWTRILATGPELRAYLERVAADYDLVDKMSFRSAVERAVWDEERGRWVLTVRDLEGGGTYEHECQFLFSGTGHFSKPRELDVPGLERFQGGAMHSARWKDDVGLEGKRVVVFGNGCTATQIVPALVKMGVERVTQIVRAKHWIMPPVDETVPRWAREVLQWTPGMLALQRWIVFCVAEMAYLSFPVRNRWIRRFNQKTSEAYMKATAPEKYWGMLIPEFEFGCKRRVFDTGYLEALHREDVVLTDEPAVEIVEEGVRLKSGEVVEADVIVLANGFEMNELLEGVEVVGRGGETLHQHWENTGGLGAYKTLCVSSHPNFFFPLGLFPHLSQQEVADTDHRSEQRDSSYIKRYLDRKRRQSRLEGHQAAARRPGQRGRGEAGSRKGVDRQDPAEAARDDLVIDTVSELVQQGTRCSSGSRREKDAALERHALSLVLGPLLVDEPVSNKSRLGVPGELTPPPNVWLRC